MKDDQLRDWEGKHGKSASESLREFVLEFVGKPIASMLRYCLKPKVVVVVVAVVAAAVAAASSGSSSSSSSRMYEKSLFFITAV